MRIRIAAAPAALLTAVVMLLAFPPPVAAQNLTTADETYCYNKLMSGTVQWNAGGASNWNQANAIDFCRNINRPQEVIDCFVREVRKSDNWQTAEAACKTPEYGGGVRLQDTGRAVDVRTRRDNQAQQCVDQIESALSRVKATEDTRNFYANKLCNTPGPDGLLPWQYQSAGGQRLVPDQWVFVRQCSLMRELDSGTPLDTAVQVSINEGTSFFNPDQNSCFYRNVQKYAKAAEVFIKSEAQKPVFGLFVGTRGQTKFNTYEVKYQPFNLSYELPIQIELPFDYNSSKLAFSWNTILLFVSDRARQNFMLNEASKNALRTMAKYLDDSKKLPGSTLTDAACGLKETVCATAEGLFKLTDKALTKLGVSDYSGVIIGAYPDIGAYFGVTHPLYYGISGYPPRLSVLSQEPKAGVPNVVASTSTQNAAPAQGAASQMTMRACERALRDPTRLRTDMADKITAGVVAELCQGQEDITAPADCFHQFAAGKVPWSTKARNSPMPNYYSTWSVKSIVDACKSATVPGAISGCVTLWVYTGHTSIDAVKSCRQGGTSSATAQDCRPTDWNGMWNVQDGYNEQFLVIVPVVHGQDVAFKGTTIPSGLAFNGTIPAANACEVRGQWTSSAANGQFRFVMKPRLGNVAQANAFSGIWTRGDADPVGQRDNWFAQRTP